MDLNDVDALIANPGESEVDAEKRVLGDDA
jgi:hypothetical protein